MITVKKSPTADTRTCDFANTSKETLLASSRQHIGDVVKAMAFFLSRITEAAGEHDYDKLTAIDWFHADFVTGFKQTGWWDNHRRIHRHHIDKPDGVPADVNLLDVLEHIADCVMAGMARSGSVYELNLSDELLQTAFKNTVELLKAQVSVGDKSPMEKERDEWKAIAEANAKDWCEISDALGEGGKDFEKPMEKLKALIAERNQKDAIITELKGALAELLQGATT